ncbi:MAG: hypothetical protein ABIJ00_07610 [Candidatus Eisenbacteria bacterium]
MNARKRFVCLLMIIALCCLASGCNETSCTGSDSTGPIGRLVRSTGCKTWELATDTDGVASDQDCIEWRLDAPGRLLLTHVNAGFNCCPKFDAVTYVENDTIFIVERELEGQCDCICLFDLDYEIRDLEPGVYEVIVNQECLREDDEPLDFTVDLLTSPSGRHCVERTHYPWGH